MHRRLKVALLIESSRAYGRGLLRGVAAYIRAHRPWSTYVAPRGLTEPLPRWLKAWKGDGILARINDRRMAELIQETGLPAIDLRGCAPDSRIPTLGVNAVSVARLAFEHLRERGLRHFAFCSAAPQYHFFDERGVEFERMASEAGCSFGIFPTSNNIRPATNWDEEQQQLANWVAQLPKPVGILASHDERGVDLLNACQDLQIAVPDDVAVIGVDNDEVMCELANPPLSSVDPNTERIGYRAAELLEQVMAGKLHLSDTRLEPGGIVARRSTDVLAMNDPEIAAAMRFIHEHACDGINVEDVLQHTRLSRRTLERRLAELFGRSPRDEILRLRVERVKQLLVETNHPLSRIADLAGIIHPEHLGRLFRRVTGQTPGEYRQAMRAIGRRPAD